MTPITIPQDNPQNTLLEGFTTKGGFLWEALTAYEEPIWRRIIEEDLLQRLQLEGRALALSSPQVALWLALCLSKIDKGDASTLSSQCPMVRCANGASNWRKPFSRRH